MTICFFRKSVSIVLFLTLASLAAPAGTITFRFVAGTALYQQPTLLTEVLPGVFYSSGVNEVAFSVTPQGQLTSLANFNPSSLQHPFVTGANRRAYNSIGGTSSNVVSIGLSPGTKRVYANLNLAAFLTQNLPGGTLLGFGNNDANNFGALNSSDFLPDSSSSTLTLQVTPVAGSGSSFYSAACSGLLDTGAQVVSRFTRRSPPPLL